MGILSFVPDLLKSAEQAYPGHGAELLQAMDSVSTATFFVGVFFGVVLAHIVFCALPFIVNWSRGCLPVSTSKD